MSLKVAKRLFDFLTKYYGVRRMKIVLNGRKVGNRYAAYYYESKSYFTKRGLNRRTVLHELYRHLVHVNGLDIAQTREERSANSYSRAFLG